MKQSIVKREPVLIYHGSAMAASAAQLELLHLPTWLHTIIVIASFLISAGATRRVVTPNTENN